MFFLARVLLQAAPEAVQPSQAGWLALLVAGLWLLHALHISTVLYTVQRMAQLSALFVFAGLLVHIYMAAIAKGMRPAFISMFTGYVPADYAASHHKHWFDSLKNSHKINTLENGSEN